MVKLSSGGHQRFTGVNSCHATVTNRKKPQNSVLTTYCNCTLKSLLFESFTSCRKKSSTYFNSLEPIFYSVVVYMSTGLGETWGAFFWDDRVQDQ